MQADGHDDWQRGESAFRELKTAVKMISDRDLTARFDDIDVQLFRVEREYDAEIHISTFTREDGDSPVSGNRYVFHADGRVDVTSSDDGHATKTVIDGLLDGAIHLLTHALTELRGGSPKENGGLKRMIRTALRDCESRSG